MQDQPTNNRFYSTLEKNDINYKAIYTSCFPMIRNMVLKNSGTLEDAKDIFQEIIIILYQKSGKDDFKLSVNTCTYLYSIARNKWLHHLRHYKNHSEIDDNIRFSDADPLADDDEIHQKQRLFLKHFNSIGERCQHILRLFFEGMPGEKIAEEMNFSSYEYYRVAKNRCTETLKKMIHQDPVFKELKQFY